jgi:hypothetical protein
LVNRSLPLKGTPPILAETMGGRVHFAWVPSLSVNAEVNRALKSQAGPKPQ